MLPALTTYLNDHHAGAHAALSLLDRLRGEQPTRVAWVDQLRADIEQDRQTLSDVMRRLHVVQSSVKQISGWIGEQLLSLKLALEGPDHAFQFMQALEVLSIGILGKQKLWSALAAVAGAYPELSDVDFHALEARAVDQHARTERERIASVRMAFGTGNDGAPA